MQKYLLGRSTDGVKVDKAADMNNDNVVNIYDLLLAKKYLLNGFPQTRSAVTADVSGNNTNDVSDIVVLTKFLHGNIKQFPEQQEVS